MDIRGKRTREAIEKAFLELLREKPAGRITVTELCQIAGINRATFYKHYLDVPDLQIALEQGVLRDFEAFLADSAAPGDGKYRAALLQMLEYMQQNGSRFYLLCSGNAGSELPARAFQLFNHYALPMVREKLPTQDPARINLLYRFLARGCGALLVSWGRGASDMTAEEMTDFILRLSAAAVDAAAEGSGYHDGK